MSSGKTYTGKREKEQVCREIPTSMEERDLSLEGMYRKISDATSMSERCGRKWVVLAASFVTLHIGTGFVFNMTVLNIAFLEAFGRSNAETSLVQSVTAGVFSIAGLPVGVAVGKYGVRKVGMCGSLLAALGLVVSFFATSVPYLVVAIGLITAVGLSACHIATLTGVGEYFHGKSKLEAFSFLSFGSGCGAISYPYLLNYLIGEIGWRGCLLIVGGMMLNLVPCLAVFTPRTLGVSGPNQSYTNSIDRISVSTISSTSALYPPKDDGVYAKLKMLKNNKLFVINTFSLFILIPTMNSLVIFLINFLQFKGFDLIHKLKYFCIQ